MFTRVERVHTWVRYCLTSQPYSQYNDGLGRMVFLGNVKVRLLFAVSSNMLDHLFPNSNSNFARNENTFNFFTSLGNIENGGTVRYHSKMLSLILILSKTNRAQF